MLDTAPLLQPTSFPSIQRKKLTTLQVNIGLKCNLQCQHCHVDAGPRRTEEMTKETCLQVLNLIEQEHIQILDLTGGAPELNPNFRFLIKEARKLNCHVIDRCNLTVLFEPNQEDTAEFLAKNKVEIVASLPCYLAENVDKQRGKGTFDASIKALQLLNKLGYGKQGSGLILTLVFNPQDDSLPPPQAALEMDYRKKLSAELNLVFNRLITITNMPIKRFGSMLLSKNRFYTYLETLKTAYKNENLDAVMCKNLISIDWQGYIYDCDFNQMLEMPIKLDGNKATHISEIKATLLKDKNIKTGEHCYGCTAGNGSSCGGSLS